MDAGEIAVPCLGWESKLTLISLAVTLALDLSCSLSFKEKLKLGILKDFVRSDVTCKQ